MNVPQFDHLLESHLHEYLDGALDATAASQVEAHLGECAACRARRDEIASVFQALEDLPAAYLRRDLSGSVMRGIRAAEEPPRVYRLLSVAQLGSALTLLVLLIPLMAPSLLDLDLGGWISNWITPLQSSLAMWSRLWGVASGWGSRFLGASINLSHHLPSFSLGHPYGWVWIPLAALLWLTANTILLPDAWEHGFPENGKHSSGGS